MDWVAELFQKFQQVRRGQAAAPVSFAGRPGMIGEMGQQFNALAVELGAATANGWTREQAHRLRNHLAGLLAALHVLREGGSLSAEQQSQITDLVATARELDTALRARTR